MRRLVIALAALAAAVRLAPLLVRGELDGVLAYDDGVYFAGAQRLVAGELPYQDFLFLHPPGILLLLAPFAALSDVVGEAAAFALARLGWVAVGVVNTVLIARLLRRFGSAAMVGGAGLYAVWSASVEPERTLLQEPLLTLALLGALTLLARERSRRAAVAAGVLLGLSLSVKLWPLPLIGVVALWLWRERTPRDGLALLGGAAAAVAAWLVPFVLLTGGDMLDQVVTQQGERPREGIGIGDRVDAFDGLVGVPGVDDAVPGALLVLGALVAGAALAYAVVRARDAAVWLWAALAAVALAELLAAPSFYTHYAAFAAPLLCLLAGVAVARAGELRPLAAAGLVVLAALALSSMRVEAAANPDRAVLEAFAEERRCVWARSPALLVLAEAGTEAIDRRCPVWVDPAGHLVELGPEDPESRPLFDQAPRAQRWQAAVQRQLAGSDGAILLGPLEDQLWSADTAARFRARFEQAGASGSVSLWRAR